jgi:predicted DNA-binding transcriptional regulator AlpA
MNSSDDLIRGYRQLTKVVPYSREYLWRMIRAGTFPAPIELGPNALAWIAEEVRQWKAARPRRIPNPPKAKEAA